MTACCDSLLWVVAITESEAGDLVLLWREMFERDVEKRHIRMLQLKGFFPHGKGTVTDGEQLLLVEVELALVVDGPFKLACHPQGVDGTGVDAESAEETARHVHIVFFGIPFRGFPGDFGADHPDHA